MRGKRSFFSLSTLITKLKCKIKKKKDEMSRITLKYIFKNKVKMLKSLSWRFTTIDELAVNLQNGPQKQRNSSSLEAIRCIVLYRKILQDIPDPDPPKIESHVPVHRQTSKQTPGCVCVCCTVLTSQSVCWSSLILTVPCWASDNSLSPLIDHCVGLVPDVCVCDLFLCHLKRLSSVQACTHTHTHRVNGERSGGWSLLSLTPAHNPSESWQ